jgi:ABC-type uncharacterized transport system permease subunit
MNAFPNYIALPTFYLFEKVGNASFMVVTKPSYYIWGDFSILISILSSGDIQPLSAYPQIEQQISAPLPYRMSTYYPGSKSYCLKEAIKC